MKDLYNQLLDNLHTRILPLFLPWKWHADDRIMLVDEEPEEPTCPEGVCDGSGEVQDYYWDNDAKVMMPDGTKPCICRDTRDHDPDL